MPRSCALIIPEQPIISFPRGHRKFLLLGERQARVRHKRCPTASAARRLANTERPPEPVCMESNMFDPAIHPLGDLLIAFRELGKRRAQIAKREPRQQVGSRLLDAPVRIMQVTAAVLRRISMARVFVRLTCNFPSPSIICGSEIQDRRFVAFDRLPLHLADEWRRITDLNSDCNASVSSPLWPAARKATVQRHCASPVAIISAGKSSGHRSLRRQRHMPLAFGGFRGFIELQLDIRFARRSVLLCSTRGVSSCRRDSPKRGSAGSQHHGLARSRTRILRCQIGSAS